MPKTRIPSPSRSVGSTTPRRYKHRGSRSVNSPAPSNASGRLTAIIDQFKEQEMDSFRMSPMRTRWSVLTDNTDIEEPRRKSWWKNLNENSQDLMMVLEDNKTTDSNNSVEDISDLEILSQENRNYSLDLPESSDSESIHSIVIPQRKLFTQKENKPQKKFGQIVGARETLNKLHKSNTTFHEKSIAAGTKDLFPGAKKAKPVFSAALLNVSANKTTTDKTTENVTGESKVVVKNIFGNRPAKKRKNMFSDFILPDEPETSEKKSKKGTVENIQNANEQAQVESKKNTEINKKETSKQIVNQQMYDGNEDEDQIINEQAKDNLESNQLEQETRKIVSSRETMDELHEPNKTHDEIIIASTKDLFQGSKKSKPVLSSTLLNISGNKTVADKTNVNMTSEPIMPVKNIFGNRPDKKRKNIFADFIVSYSEHETSEIKTPEKEATINKSRNINETTRSKRANVTNENKKLDTEQSERMIIEDKVNQKKDDVIESEDERIDECQEVYSEATENFKSNQPQKKIRKLADARETMDKLHKTNISLNDDIVTAGTKDLFQGAKKSNIVFSSTLLHISPNKTVTDKAETNVLDPKILVKNIFGSRSPNKRKNIFADFIESESEHEISEIRVQEKEDSIIAMAPHTNEDQDNEAHGITEVNAVQSVKGNQGKEGINKSEEEVHQEKKEASKSKQNKTLSAEQRSDFLKRTSSRLYQEEVVSQKEVKNDIEVEHAANINEELEKISKGIESSEKECNEDEEEKENSNQSNSADGSNIINQIEEVTAIESENDEEMNYEESDEEIQEAVRSHEEECVIDKEDEDNEKGGEDNQAKILSENDKEDGRESENGEEMNYEESDEEILEPDRSQEQVCNENEEKQVIPNQKDEVEEIDEHDKIDNKEDAEQVEDNIEMNKHLEDNDKIIEDEEDNEIEDEEAENEENDDDEMEEHLEDNDQINEDEVDNGIDNEEAENQEKDDEEVNKSLEVHTEVNEFEEDNEIDNNDEDSDEEINEQNKSDDDKNDEGMNETGVHDEVNELSEEVEDNESESEEAMDYEESEEENPEVNRTEEEEESIDNENAKQITENQELHNEVNESHVEHDTESDDEEMKYEESDEEIQENVKTQDDNIRNSKENEQIEQNQEVRNKFNDLKEVSAPVDSSAEGSGWDSHRVTRKTLRQTFGKEFTPRKSLRALVMEKSAKQTANVPKLHSETIMIPQANSTEFPENSNVDDDIAMESDHELSRRTRQTTLETYLQKMKQQNIEKNLKMNQAIRNSLQVPQTRDTLNLFKVPLKPAPRKLKPASNKPKKQLKTILFGELPSEVIEDMKYKPPKRFQPSNASWITKRLYKFLEQKLEPKYDYKARIRAEKLVETIYHFAKELRRHNVAPIDSVDVLKHELARLGIVKTHFEFYDFFHEFMPREIRVKVVPDVVNKIPLPRHGVFADILKANAIQG